MPATTHIGLPNRCFRRPLFSEALGLTDDQSPYVYLSDGGHFENMGLFEMVLRRCRLIVASDAGADPDYQFEDLGTRCARSASISEFQSTSSIAIRKRSESMDRIDEDGDDCTLGRIHIPSSMDVMLLMAVPICIKPALYGKEPQDVLNYAAQKTAFPQEPTSDQFFGESQFESYRQLGEFEAQFTFGDAEDPPAGKSWAWILVTRVRDYLRLDREAWLDQWLDTLPDARPEELSRPIPDPDRWSDDAMKGILPGPAVKLLEDLRRSIAVRTENIIRSAKLVGGT